MQYVVAVLPDRLGHDERRFLRDASEYLHSPLLAVDETVAFIGIHGVRTLNAPSLPLDGLGQLSLHGRLGFLAVLIGGEAEIAVGNEVSGFHGVFWEGELIYSHPLRLGENFLKEASSSSTCEQPHRIPAGCLWMGVPRPKEHVNNIMAERDDTSEVGELPWLLAAGGCCWAVVRDITPTRRLRGSAPVTKRPI